MALPCLPLYHPTASLTPKNSNLNPYGFHSLTAKFNRSSTIACRSTSSSSSSPSSITDFDLYDLLGINSSSDLKQIKMAYRSLQKRCHPDIAGSPGHDMAIILNEAYKVLSDPNSRMAYDKEHAKTAELRGFTGKPIYSVWFGPECEQRAVFVDEVKCVGCLKCALLAEKTFAIESAYGRARVVAQWADPEYKIQSAIEACPVDCISMVERSNLAALEFLMSKQPRSPVRMSSGNTIGERVSNIFVDVAKFQTKFHEKMDKATTHSNEKDLRKEARVSAIQAIRSISNWLYWQAPIASSTVSHKSIARIAQKSTDSNINKLRDAVRARKQARESPRTASQPSSGSMGREEYWIPTAHVLPSSTSNSTKSPALKPPQTKDRRRKTKPRNHEESQNKMINKGLWIIPMGAATFAALIVRLQVGYGHVDGLKEHFAGSLALDVVNSPWMQVSLAGITWYFIGSAMIQLIEAIKSNR